VICSSNSSLIQKSNSFTKVLMKYFVAFLSISMSKRGRCARWGFAAGLPMNFFLIHKKAPGSQSIQDALNVLGGKALHEGPEIMTHTRIAAHDGKLYLDLGISHGESLRLVQADGKLSRRTSRSNLCDLAGCCPIPAPSSDGTLDDLREFLNLPDDGSFALIKAVLVAALRPGLPFPVLVLKGEQGTGKSTISAICKTLIDPSKAPKRGLPRDTRDLAI